MSSSRRKFVYDFLYFLEPSIFPFFILYSVSQFLFFSSLSFILSVKTFIFSYFFFSLQFYLSFSLLLLSTVTIFKHFNIISLLLFYFSFCHFYAHKSIFTNLKALILKLSIEQDVTSTFVHMILNEYFYRHIRVKTLRLMKSHKMSL